VQSWASTCVSQSLLVTTHGKPRQTALERQDLSRMYLAHHELELSKFVIISIIIAIIMGNQDRCDGAGDSCLG